MPGKLMTLGLMGMLATHGVDTPAMASSASSGLPAVGELPSITNGPRTVSVSDAHAHASWPPELDPRLDCQAPTTSLLRPPTVPRRDYSHGPEAAGALDVVASFATKHGLSDEDLAHLHRATKGLTFRVVSQITDPVVADYLRVATINPVKRAIQEDPSKSNFQNEDVTKFTGTSPNIPYSNFGMHLAAGGQDGVHVHPFGPRDLIVFSATPWTLLVGRAVKPGEDAAAIKKIARVTFPAGQTIVSLPANRPHGFESQGDDTVAYSIHGFDEQEVMQAGIQDSKDVMAKLTRDLGSEGLTIIGKTDVPCEVVQALHQPPILH